MRGINYTALWIKALYKCWPFNYLTCHLADAFIQSHLQLIRLSRRPTPWSIMGLRAMLKGQQLHLGSNHRPCGSKSSSLTATLQAASNGRSAPTRNPLAVRRHQLRATPPVLSAAVMTASAARIHLVGEIGLQERPYFSAVRDLEMSTCERLNSRVIFQRYHFTEVRKLFKASASRL